MFKGQDPRRPPYRVSGEGQNPILGAPKGIPWYIRITYIPGVLHTHSGCTSSFWVAHQYLDFAVREYVANWLTSLLGYRTAMNLKVQPHGSTRLGLLLSCCSLAASFGCCLLHSTLGHSATVARPLCRS
jgi:hypothetical protein